MRIATSEEVKAVRDVTGLGMQSSLIALQNRYAKEAIHEAKTLKELKPVLLWMIAQNNRSGISDEVFKLIKEATEPQPKAKEIEFIDPQVIRQLDNLSIRSKD